MKLPKSKALAILCLMAFMTGCNTSEKQAIEIGTANSAVAVVEQAKQIALRPAAKLPAYPSDCRKKEKAGLQRSDSQELMIFKYDTALGKANSRIDRCAKFYDSVSKTREAE